MDFSEALKLIKAGALMSRSGWNGRGMFVFLVDGSKFNVSRAPLSGIFPVGTPIEYNPHIDIKNANGTISTWVPSIGDILASDWTSVEVPTQQ